MLSFLLNSMRRLGPLEVVADRDLVLRLDDRVVHLGVVDLADDVERMIIGHGRDSRISNRSHGTRHANLAATTGIPSGFPPEGKGPGAPSCSARSPGRYWGVLRGQTEPQFNTAKGETHMRASHSSPRGIGRRGFLGTAGTLAVAGPWDRPAGARGIQGRTRRSASGSSASATGDRSCSRTCSRFPASRCGGSATSTPITSRRARRWSPAQASPEPAGTDDWKALLEAARHRRDRQRHPLRSSSSELPRRHRRRQGPLRREADVPDAGRPRRGGRGGEGQQADRPDRPPAPRRSPVHRDHAPGPRRRDRAARRGPDPLVELLGAAPGLVRPAQAVRRLDRRAGRSQLGRAQLGHRRLSPSGRRRWAATIFSAISSPTATCTTTTPAWSNTPAASS